MNLEPIMQSKVSEKEKNKYRILTHIYGIQKRQQQGSNGDADIKNRLVNTVGQAQGGTTYTMYIEIYTLLSGKQTANAM